MESRDLDRFEAGSQITVAIHKSTVHNPSYSDEIPVLKPTSVCTNVRMSEREGLGQVHLTRSVNHETDLVIPGKSNSHTHTRYYLQLKNK